MHNLVSATSGGNPIKNGNTVNIVEENDFNFTCSTTNVAADVTLLTDIVIPGSTIDSTRNFYLINVQRILTGTVISCTDGTVVLILSHLLSMRYVS